jgi:hypothetical protein
VLGPDIHDLPTEPAVTTDISSAANSVKSPSPVVTTPVVTTPGNSSTMSNEKVN